MHFVNQIDLVASAGRFVLSVIEQLTCAVNAVIRRRIHLYQVEKSTSFNVLAKTALATRLCRHTCLTIEAFGKNSGDRGLTDTANTGKQVSMVQPTRLERIDQRFDDMVLSNQIRKGLRPPLAGEHLITQ